VDGAVLYPLDETASTPCTVTATLNLPLPSSPAFQTRCQSRRLVLVLLLLLLLLLKRRLLWMVLYCTHRHLPGKAIQLSEVAASCAMTSCFCVACRFLLKDGFRIMFDLLYTASERVAKKAGFCVDCWLRRLSATPLRFFPYHGVFSL
jgi:hypothetical protein